jgi:hypothetical protein
MYCIAWLLSWAWQHILPAVVNMQEVLIQQTGKSLLLVLLLLAVTQEAADTAHSMSDTASSIGTCLLLLLPLLLLQAGLPPGVLNILEGPGTYLGDATVEQFEKQ